MSKPSGKEVIELGRVVTVHDSGICETDAGHGVSLRTATKGDRICMVKGGKPYIEKGKLTPAYEHDGKTIEQLMEERNKTQLKAILKSLGKEGYSKMEVDQLATFIVTGEDPTKETGGAE